MAGVKKVELIEGNTLAVTDCGKESPTLYEIDCGCDDVPSAPPPVQSSSTACNVASYLAIKLNEWFATFFPALTSFGTASFGNANQNAANSIGLPSYSLQFSLWAANLNQFVGINPVVTTYYAYANKTSDLRCWLLGCLPSTGIIDASVIECWRGKMTNAKETYPQYAPYLEAVSGFASIIPIGKWQEEAYAGSFIPAKCTSCSETDNGCSTGIWADFRNVPSDDFGWVGYSGSASPYPFPTSWNTTSRVFATSRTERGWEAPACFLGQICTGAMVIRTFQEAITLCKVKAWGTLYFHDRPGKTEENDMHSNNTRQVAIFYRKADSGWILLSSKLWVINKGEDNTGKESNYQATPRGIYATAAWNSTSDIPRIHGVVGLAFGILGGGSISAITKININDNDPVLLSATGLPYIAKPVVSVPANINQAGWNAIFSTESAGRIYEFEGVMPNLSIVPREGDVYRSKSGVIAQFYGGQTLDSWTLDQDTTYWTVYTRAVNKAGGDAGSYQGYQINNVTNYPRAHWMIVCRQAGAPLRHVANLADCRANTSTYYYDDVNGRMYVNIGFNPTSTTIEVAHTRNAFTLSVNNVIIERLMFDLYAPNFQEGAVTTPNPLSIGDTQLLGCIFNQSACNGAKVGTRSKVLENYFDYTGMTGLVAQGEELLIKDNRQTGMMNFQRTNVGFEAAFLKLSRSRYAIIQDNLAENGGLAKGLWLDLYNQNTLVKGNTVRAFGRAGIFVELSFNTLIEDNHIVDCGIGQALTSQPQNAMLAIINSQGINGQKIIVRRNLCINYGDGGGIWGITQSNRGTTEIDGDVYTLLSKNVEITDNDFYCRNIAAGSQRSGTYQDYDPNANFNTPANGLYVDDNHYHMSASIQHFQQGGSNKTMAQWQALTALEANDQNSTIDQASVPAEYA